MKRDALKMGLLGAKTEALLDLGIAATVGCDSCIHYHIAEALRSGAGEAEIRQTIDLARKMGGRSSFECCDNADEYLGTLKAGSNDASPR